MPCSCSVSVVPCSYFQGPVIAPTANQKRSRLLPAARPSRWQPAFRQRLSQRDQSMLVEKSKDTIFLAVVALILTGALWRVSSGSGEETLGGDARTQVILAVIYGGVALLAVIHFRWTLWLLLHSPALTGLLLLALLSPLWAQTPVLVFRRTIALLGTSLFGVVLAARLSLNEQARLARGVLRLTAVACLILFVVAPGHAMSTDYGTGSARGIFPHKNLFGAAMALGLL